MSKFKAETIEAAATTAGANVIAALLSAWLIMLAVGAATPLNLGYGAALLVFLGIRAVSLAWNGLGRPVAASKKEQK